MFSAIEEKPEVTKNSNIGNSWDFEGIFAGIFGEWFSPTPLLPKNLQYLFLRGSTSSRCGGRLVRVEHRRGNESNLA